MEGQAATIVEEHAALRAELAGLEERHRGERSAMGRLEQQFRETTNRRNAIAPEIERLGEERARLLADNIELDQKGALLAEQITALEAQVNEMATEDAGMREALRTDEEELKASARGRAGNAGKALADRSRPGAQTGGAEVPGRNQPQGTGCPVEELSRRRRPHSR